VIVAHPSVPARNARELIALARAQPDQLTFASNGSGTPVIDFSNSPARCPGVRMTHVPYKGAAPATLAVVSGEVSMTITTTTAILPQARAGRLRILAATTLKRLPQLPEVVTVAESGLPGYEAISWFGLVAPAALPAELVKKISSDVLRALSERAMQTAIESHGATVIANTPEQFRNQIRDDRAKWGKVVQASGARAD